MRCPRCGTLQFSGQSHCRACAARLDADQPLVLGRPVGAGAIARRRRLSSVVALVAIAFLLLVCLALTLATIGLTALTRYV